MCLAEAISSAVCAANAYTQSVQTEVQISPWIGGPLTFGGPDQFGAAVTALAFVKEGLEHTRRSDGTIIMVRARVAFWDPDAIPPNGADGRAEPIDPRDILTLPSGLSGHMRELAGILTNPETGQPFVRVVGIE